MGLITLVEEYEDRIVAGEPWEAITEEIDGREDLDVDEKAALWLCARAALPAAEQQRDAREIAAIVSEGHRSRINGSAALEAVMAAVRDHLDEARRRVGGMPPADIALERRVRAALGPDRASAHGSP